MSIYINVTGTLVFHKPSKLAGDLEMYEYVLQIPPTGKERKPKRLYLATFSKTVNGQLREAQKANVPVSLVCEVTGQPNAKDESSGLNRIKPVAVAKADESLICDGCQTPHNERDRIITIYPDKTLSCCPKCGMSREVKV